MNDRNVSMGCVVAYSLWVLVGLFLAAAWIVGQGYVADRLASTGLALSAAAATATIRQYHCNSNKLSRNAFELGRDAASVRPMR